jgi:hypothetical protein
MALERQISRLSKILVENEGISFDEAQARLRAHTLEIVATSDAITPAAHAAILTALSVGRRTFVGGVRIVGKVDQPLNSALPLQAGTLGDAVIRLGASNFSGPPSRRILVGSAAPCTYSSTWAVAPYWNGWLAGTGALGDAAYGESDNPLSGVAAGALAVAKAFEAQRGVRRELKTEINLWPSGWSVPFSEAFLPGALWLVGLGNLGQAFLWALGSLPYRDPSEISLVLQDRDKITEDNWATSVLVHDHCDGWLKTKVGEEWALAKGFDVRRIDRNLLVGDRLENDDPRVALSGVDKIASRKAMSGVGFACIIDVGLGRTSESFERYRVTVFDQSKPIDKHFAGQSDTPVGRLPTGKTLPYRLLEREVGQCGAAEIAGASVAAPYVSAIAATVAISRLIAVSSGCEYPVSEVGVVSDLGARRLGPLFKSNARGISHAGKPIILPKGGNV